MDSRPSRRRAKTSHSNVCVQPPSLDHLVTTGTSCRGCSVPSPRFGHRLAHTHATSIRTHRLLGSSPHRTLNASDLSESTMDPVRWAPQPSPRPPCMLCVAYARRCASAHVLRQIFIVVALAGCYVATPVQKAARLNGGHPCDRSVTKILITGRRNDITTRALVGSYQAHGQTGHMVVIIRILRRRTPQIKHRPPPCGPCGPYFKVTARGTRRNRPGLLSRRVRNCP